LITEMKLHTQDTVMYVSMRDNKGTSVKIPMRVRYDDERKMALTTGDADLIGLIISSMSKSHRVKFTLPLNGETFEFNTNKIKN